MKPSRVFTRPAMIKEKVANTAGRRRQQLRPCADVPAYLGRRMRDVEASDTRRLQGLLLEK